MPKDPKPRKKKIDTFYTRAKSIRLLRDGANPVETFFDEKNTERGRYLNHPNYHVRAYCWSRMGRPLPENADERAKFLASIRVKEKPVVEVVEGIIDPNTTESVIVNDEVLP